MAENNNKSRSSPKQDGVALALATGRSVRETAMECKVGERTIYRWLAQVPGFQGRISALRSSMFDQALGRLAAAQVKAAGVLDGLMDSENESIRRQASRDVCTLGLRAREVNDLTIQIAELRRTVTELENHEYQQPQTPSLRPAPSGPSPADAGSADGEQ